MVLVDTSVWVDHLRTGSRQLQLQLDAAAVLCHPYVIGELACGNLGNRDEILALLQALPSAPVLAADEFLFFLETRQLMASGIGFVDVHLLAAARLAGVRLWTKDRRLQMVAERLGMAFPTKQ